MCGIVGIIQATAADPQCLEAAVHDMADALAHRGPDGHGYWVDGTNRVALGHRRLSIIDLSDMARQPLANEDGTVLVTFNGEIYNFLEIRRELEGRGHAFRSRTDGEVIVHAYEEYGDRCVERLDGMFAFALWDARRERLLLARDRAGKKPLYYSAGSSVFLFGSEIKAILAHPLARRNVDPSALPVYLTYGYVPSPGTFYRDIVQVPPASYLVLERGEVRGPFAYWALEYPEKGNELQVTSGEAGAEIRRLLGAAVSRRLVSDVPLGAFLSGGVDSSIVTGLMCQLSGNRVRTFSIGFSGDAAFDETPYATEVARHFGTEHTSFVVEPKAFELVDTLLWHHDQPYGDSSAIPTYVLSRLAKQHVTVALNGDGGDELFAGYDRFVHTLVSERVSRRAMAFGREVMQRLPASLRRLDTGGRVERYLGTAAKPLSERYLGWCSFFSRDLLAQLMEGPVPADIGESFDNCLRQTARQPLLHRMLHLNFNTYLHDDLLVKMDRMSMAHGLETRSPFLDTALIEYVARLPPTLKIRRGTLKYVLKRTFEGLVPPRILARRKRGFVVPLDDWYRHELRELVGDLLLSPTARHRRFLRPECVRRIHDEHQHRVHNWGSELWALTTLELWLQRQDTAAAA